MRVVIRLHTGVALREPGKPCQKVGQGPGLGPWGPRVQANGVGFWVLGAQKPTPHPRRGPIRIVVSNAIERVFRFLRWETGNRRFWVAPQHNPAPGGPEKGPDRGPSSFCTDFQPGRPSLRPFREVFVNPLVTALQGLHVQPEPNKFSGPCWLSRDKVMLSSLMMLDHPYGRGADTETP